MILSSHFGRLASRGRQWISRDFSRNLQMFLNFLVSIYIFPWTTQSSAKCQENAKIWSLLKLNDFGASVNPSSSDSIPISDAAALQRKGPGATPQEILTAGRQTKLNKLDVTRRFIQKNPFIIKKHSFEAVACSASTCSCLQIKLRAFETLNTHCTQPRTPAADVSEAPWPRTCAPTLLSVKVASEIQFLSVLWILSKSSIQASEWQR